MSQQNSYQNQLEEREETEVLVSNQETDQYDEGEEVEEDNVQQDNDNHDQYEQSLTNQPHDPIQTPQQQSPSLQLNITHNNPLPHFTKPTNKKDSLHTQLTQLQSRLYHQIILITQLTNQPQQNKQIIRKLARPILQRVNQLYEQIYMLQGKLDNGLLMNYMERRDIKEKILEKRMDELANMKVLCNIYRHHEYRLLLSTLHITLIYQQLGCHEQALEHLQTIKQTNSKYRATPFSLQNIDAEYMHAMILTLYALSQCQLMKYQDSIVCLNKAILIEERLKENGYKVNEYFTLNLKAIVLTGSKQYKQAIVFANMALQSAITLFTGNSIQCAIAYKSLAQAQSANSQFNQSIEHIIRSIQILQHTAPQKQQLIIEYYTKLTEFKFKQLNSIHLVEQKSDHFLPFIAVLRKKYQVIENTFGYRDKRAIKDKRHLATCLLKYQRVDQAEEELQDILEIQQTVYGEKSVEVAKTLKMLGSIAMSKSQTAKAQKLFRKSMGIFHDQGEVGLQKQVQGKILVLTGKGRFVHSKP